MSRKIDTDYKGQLEKYQKSYQTKCRVYSYIYFVVAALLLGIAAIDYWKWEGKALHVSVISFDDKSLVIGALFSAFFGALSHRASKGIIPWFFAKKFLENKGIDGSDARTTYNQIGGRFPLEPQERVKLTEYDIETAKQNKASLVQAIATSESEKSDMRPSLDPKNWQRRYGGGESMPVAQDPPAPREKPKQPRKYKVYHSAIKFPNP